MHDNRVRTATGERLAESLPHHPANLPDFHPMPQVGTCETGNLRYTHCHGQAGRD